MQDCVDCSQEVIAANLGDSQTMETCSLLHLAVLAGPRL